MSLLQMFRGDTFTFTRTVVDAQGQPVDLSAADVTFTARQSVPWGSDTAVPLVIRKTIGDGVELGASGETGEVTVTIDPTDTAGLTQTERFVWDIQYDDIVTIATPFIGRLVVQLDVGDMAASGS